jgi:hypothetical protein
VNSEQLTLGCISAGPVLHQHIVERLMVAVRPAVHIHVPDPLVSVDNTVIAIPNEHKRTLVRSLRPRHSHSTVE